VFVAGATLASVAGAAVFEFESMTAGASVTGAAGSSATESSTDTFPCNAGNEIRKATIIKVAAAAIVIFDRTEAVPRGPNAALETLLVNNAPASVLPGCSNTEPISVMQAIKNKAYKTYNKVSFLPFD
jgi:hypothetical protein